jgi:hypothetical protein
MKLLGIALGATALALLCGSPAAADVTVAPAATTISLDSGAERGTTPCGDSFVGAAALRCQRSIPASDGMNFGVLVDEDGTGNTTGGKALQTLSISDPGFVNFSAPGTMTTSLTYFLKVVQTAPLSATELVIPIAFHRDVEIDVHDSDTTGSSAEACVTGVSHFGGTSGGPSCVEVRDASGPPSLVDDTDLQFGFEASDLQNGTAVGEVDVELDAACWLETHSGGSASCRAFADPVIGFDQAAFDAAMGTNTFRLGDFFELRASDGIAVPEPSRAALSAGALLALAAVARARSRGLSGPACRGC